MAQGIFWVREVATRPEPASCVLIGEVRSGTVTPAMLVSIPLNSAISVSLRIKAVGYWENTQELALWLDCEDLDEAEQIKALDMSDEELVCQDEGDPDQVQ
jgi:hypothetical protein